MEIYSILHNIRSAHNVGSMLRTADAAGVTKVYVTGYTPTPLDAFGIVRPEIAKTALGAELTVPWEHIPNITTIVTALREQGVYIIGLEQHTRAIEYRLVKPEKSFALIVGNEVLGLSEPVLKKCDVIAEISMHGKKESLNVGVAFGIALFTMNKG